MKRPLALYFVAAWCCLVMILWAAIVCGTCSPRLHYLQSLALIAATSTFAALLTAGLLQLKPLSRWLCIAFLVGQVALVFFSVVNRLTGPEFASYPEIMATDVSPHQKLHALLGGIIVITPSIICVWYLSRCSFREFARRFVEERQRRG